MGSYFSFSRVQPVQSWPLNTDIVLVDKSIHETLDYFWSTASPNMVVEYRYVPVDRSIYEKLDYFWSTASPNMVVEYRYSPG